MSNRGQRPRTAGNILSISLEGCTPLEELKTKSEQPFDEEHDFALYAEPAKTYFTAQPGDIYLMFPEDAHAPIIGTGKMKKAICKLLID